MQLDLLPTDVLYVIFDKMAVPELSAMRSTNSIMRYSIDGYILHKFAKKRLQDDMFSNGMKFIYEVVEAVVRKESEKCSFILNAFGMQYGQILFKSFIDVRRALKILSRITCGNPVLKLMCGHPSYDRSILTVLPDISANLVLYHLSLFKLLKEVMKNGYSQISSKRMENELEILLEKRQRIKNGFPVIFSIIAEILTEIGYECKKNLLRIPEDRRIKKKSKMYMKLSGPSMFLALVNKKTNMKKIGRCVKHLMETVPTNFIFTYCFDLEEYGYITNTYYTYEFN